MYRNHISYSSSSKHLSHIISGKGNSLGIGNPTFIWDRKNKQLVLIMDTNQMISKEIRAHLKGNRLMLEAPLISSYNKPFRTHNLGPEFRDEVNEGFEVIANSEIKLKYGYRYHLISCQALGMNTIKVILGFSAWGRNGNN